MDQRDVKQMLALSGIPPFAYSTTLQTTGQVLLRSIIIDKAYQTKGSLKSISLLQPARMPRTLFQQICARFAAELALSGQSVLYVGPNTIYRELMRYQHGADRTDTMSSVLGHKGFLMVTDLEDLDPSAAQHVHEFLFDFAAAGGAVLLPRRWRPEQPSSRADLGAYEVAAEAMIQAPLTFGGANV